MRRDDIAPAHINYENPYPTVRRPLFARNVVSTSQQLASFAGAQALSRGGNAVDAILATAITLTIVEPISNGLGSDAFALIWDPREKKLHGLNSSGPAPARWTPSRFAGKKSMPQRGWDSVTVPGAVGAWVTMHKRFGRLPFDQLFEAAIRYAEEGYLVSQFVASRWAQQVPELKVQPGFPEAFMPGGRAPNAGELFKLPAAARTLRKIAATHGEAFYRGEIAEQIVAYAAKTGGVISAADMAGYKPQWVPPIDMNYRGMTVHEIPPNGQGIVALMALGMLRHFDMASHPVDGADSVHLQIEALKLAFADAHAYVGEPNTMRVTPHALLDPDYLKARAKLIDLKRAQDFSHGKPPGSGTVYLNAADSDGMMVSMIQSNFAGFGSGVVVPECGVSLQNRGGGFSLAPGHPNEVGPGKRPFHTIIPGFVTQNGEALM
ncbi:MAG: gamma-glutamyltransferase family protein, partial [Burkholderiales bacterium]